LVEKRWTDATAETARMPTDFGEPRGVSRRFTPPNRPLTRLGSPGSIFEIPSRFPIFQSFPP
jgi:hypothetical protein